MFDKNYLGHEIISDPEAKEWGGNHEWFICATCKINLYLSLDKKVLYHDRIFESPLLINEPLNITCEEYQIKKLLE